MLLGLIIIILKMRELFQIPNIEKNIKKIFSQSKKK